MTAHLWQGTLLDDAGFEARLPHLERDVLDALQRPFALPDLLRACGHLADDLRPGTTLHDTLADTVLAGGQADPAQVAARLAGIRSFLTPDSLRRKVRRELGDPSLLDLRRPDLREAVFEGWQPLGLLVHVAASNAFTVGLLSLIEGLLAGNVSLLKTSQRETLFAQQALAALIERDDSGTLAPRIIAARIPSSRTDWLRPVLAAADGVAVWGGEAAVAGIRDLAPPHARLVVWGHKISLAYVTAECQDDPAVLDALAHDICANEQRACSSPQCVYVEADDTASLEAYAQRLADTLRTVSPTVPRIAPDLAEQAEITTVREVHRMDALLGEGALIEAEDDSWRVLVDHRPALRASPLYRTIWVKALPAHRLVEVLRPMRAYLQTVGLAAPRARLTALARQCYAAGLDRVRPVGGMTQGYLGEPHDGVYALQRYSRRVSLIAPGQLDDVADLRELERHDVPPPAASVPVQGREDFRQANQEAQGVDLVVRSGGSSGNPVLSGYTYADYETQMQFAADGLLAAGLTADDRCINLFAAGNLYGGFLSFFTILEHAGVRQYPMATHLDLAEVAACIVREGITTVLGMPSHLLRLFREQHEVLAHGPVRKVFYGGDRFTPSQRRWLQQSCGIEIVRSAVYGSNDLGPMGYQSAACGAQEFHLFQPLQTLEIFDLDRDVPAAPGAPGRLLFTPRLRSGPRIQRYAVGDVGRWVEGTASDARRGPRFELLGRRDDLILTGDGWVSYPQMLDALSDAFDYAGEAQVLLSGDANRPTLTLRVETTLDADDATLRAALPAGWQALAERLQLVRLTSADFTRSGSTGKLLHVIDTRTA